jgi:hypothetical protein
MKTGLCGHRRLSLGAARIKLQTQGLVPVFEAKVIREFAGDRQQDVEEHEGHPLNGRLGILRA